MHSESRVATGWWYWQSYLMTFDNSCLMTLICGDDIGQLLLPLADEIDNHAWWCLITLDLRWWHWSVVMTVIMPYSDDDVQNLPHQSTKVFYTCVVHTLPRRHLICNEFPINLFLQKRLAKLTLNVMFLIKGCSIRWVCKTVASTEYFVVLFIWWKDAQKQNTWHPPSLRWQRFIIPNVCEVNRIKESCYTTLKK